MHTKRTFGGFAPVAGLAALALSMGVAFVGCGGGAETPPEGTPGQACYPNNTCNAGLACTNGKCVENPSGVTSSSNGGGGSSTATTTSGSTSEGGSSSTTTTNSTGAAGGSGGSAGAPPGNLPPLFLSFGTDVSSITQGQTVTVSAVLTDPDGIDDIIGGTLTDQSGATYGAFATSGEEGAYQLSVSWDLFNQVSPIEFAYGATSQRVLTAQFFDQEGNSVEQSTTITLTCKGDAACDGTCTDTTKTAAHCGTCGHACDSGTGCYDSKCGKLSTCLPIASSCDAACAAKGKVCKDLCGTDALSVFYHQTCTPSSDRYQLGACSQSPSDGEAMKCCCF